MNTSFANLSAQQLRRAAAIKDQIESLEKEFQQIFRAPPKADEAQTLAQSPAKKKKRRMSAAARAKISAAAKARWAKIKAAKK